MDRRWLFLYLASTLVFSLSNTLPIATQELLAGCGDVQPAASALAQRLCASVDFLPALHHLEIEGVNNARVLLRELLRFLILKVISHDDGVGTQETRRWLSPSQKVDQAWRALLLRPQLYADVCSALGCSGTIEYDSFAAQARGLTQPLQ